MIDDQALLEEFVTESSEHLEAIEEQLLELERQGSEVDRELVNTVFRSLHSIKGSAAFLALEALQALAHAGENLLDKMRSGELDPNSENISALLAAADLLQRMIEDLPASESMADQGLIDRLHNEVEGDRPTPSVAVVEPSVPTLLRPDGQPCELQVPDLASWQSAAEDHRYLYHLTYRLSEYEKATGNTVLGLMDELAIFGTVITHTIKPPTLDLRDPSSLGGLSIEMIYACLLEPEHAGSIADSGRAGLVPLLPSSAVAEVEVAASAGAEPTAPAPAAEAAPEKAPAPAQANPAQKAKPESSGGKSAASRQTVRVPTDLLDRLMNLTGELVLVRNRQLQSLNGNNVELEIQRRLAQQLNSVTNELQDSVMRTRLQQVGTVLPRYRAWCGISPASSTRSSTSSSSVKMSRWTRAFSKPWPTPLPI
jgi:two-component system chemotaxis sensor kinase CheA